jgi:hypothetical protein
MSDSILSDSWLESPAALTNLLEILSRPGALDALTFFNLTRSPILPS